MYIYAVLRFQILLFALIRIPIQLPEMMRIHADPDSKHCLYEPNEHMNPNSTLHFDADPDPDPTLYSDADQGPYPTFQFDADPDPDPILPLTFPAWPL
jgi:hypothetical protein